MKTLVVETNAMMESFFSINPKPIETLGPSCTLAPSSDVQLSKPIMRKQGEQREICVARFGKIYKRKAESNIGFLARKCRPGYRYCRHCDETLQESAFHINIKRYVCKKHHYLMVQRQRVIREENNPMDLYCTRIWYLLSCQRFFLGYDKVRFDTSDMKDIIVNSKVSMLVKPLVAPIDPQKPMRPRNVAVVSKQAFLFAVQMHSFTCSRALYIEFIQRCNLLPPNFDVSRPNDPYHDPSYKIEIIDISPILEEEKRNKNAEEIEDRIILEELEKNKDVPWINREPLSDNEGGNCREGNCWKKKKPTGVVAASNLPQKPI